MKIECANLSEFYEAIHELVKLGLGFKARTDLLTIQLTGAL